MTTERDELADIIASDRNEYADKTADRILAAGYRNPQQVTTADELDALAFQSVVRDAEGYVLERWGQPEERMWATPMNGAWIRSSEVTLPATVLYEGTQP